MFDLPGERLEYGLPIREQRDDESNYPCETDYALEREDIRMVAGEGDTSAPITYVRYVRRWPPVLIRRRRKLPRLTLWHRVEENR